MYRLHCRFWVVAHRIDSDSNPDQGPELPGRPLKSFVLRNIFFPSGKTRTFYRQLSPKWRVHSPPLAYKKEIPLYTHYALNIYYCSKYILLNKLKLV